MKNPIFTLVPLVYRILLSFVCLCSVWTFSFAQSRFKEFSELESEFIECRFSVFSQKKIKNLSFQNIESPMEGLATIERILKEGVERPLRFFSSARSFPYYYKGPRLIPVFDGVGENKKQVSSIFIQPKMKDHLFVLFYDNPLYTGGSDGELKYKTILIDDTLDDFPAGKIRIINMTTTEYSVTLGQEFIKVKPGISPAYGAGEQIRVNFLMPDTDKIIPIFTSNLRLEKDVRYTMFLFPSPHEDQIKIFPKLLTEKVELAPVINEKNEE